MRNYHYLLASLNINKFTFNLIEYFSYISLFIHIYTTLSLRFMYLATSRNQNYGFIKSEIIFINLIAKCLNYDCKCFSFSYNQLYINLFIYHNLLAHHYFLSCCSLKERTLSENQVVCINYFKSLYFHLKLAFNMSFVFYIYSKFNSFIDSNFFTIVFAYGLLFNMDLSNLFSNIWDRKEFGYEFSKINHFDIFPEITIIIYAIINLNNFVPFPYFSFNLKYFFHFYNYEYLGVLILQLYSMDTFFLHISHFFFFKMTHFQLIFVFLLKEYYNFCIIFMIIFPNIIFYYYFYLND